ncbi:MAG: hypothetical protein ACO3TI_06525 [Aquiluna sp.]|jgi:hypothetical protein
MKPILTDLARAVRNEEDYDDWDYGTEPIPGDTYWTTSTSVLSLYSNLIQQFQEAQTASYDKLAAIAVTRILSLPPETLMRLAQTFTP